MNLKALYLKKEFGYPLCKNLLNLNFLLFPHLYQRSQIDISCLVSFEVVQRVRKKLLNTRITARPAQLLRRLHKFLVDVLGESCTWVVRQYTYKHYGIVLDVGAARIIFREELANLVCAFFCSNGRRLGCFYNCRKV
jgi:hypothetical protein